MPTSESGPATKSASAAVRGFILQPTYRLEQGRAVVFLHGVLENGETFLVRDDRREPSFFIRARDAERAARLGAERLSDEEGWTTFEGSSAVRVTLAQPGDAPRLRDELAHHGVPSYQADVRFAMGYLIEHGVRGAVEIEGTWRRGPGRKHGRGIDRVYERPTLRPVPWDADWTPTLSVLSIDIETDMRAEHLLSIGLFGPGISEVLLYCPDDLEAPEGSVRLLRERDLLSTLVRRVQAVDPDIITGWNVVDFDLRVLDTLAKKYRVPLDLGRGGGRLRLRPTRSPFSTLEASIPGRVVLDGIELMRSAFIKMDSYSLGAVSKQVLGDTKMLQGSDRGGQIQEAFRSNRKLLVDYNLKDARLVVDILDTLKLVDLAVARSRLTGLPIDRVGGSIAAFDFLYLQQLHGKRIAAPTVGQNDAGVADLGGHVLEPTPGLWNNVLVFDFKSLYPSLIRTFQIDPLGYQPDDEDDPIVAPNGRQFRRQPGILPGLLDELFPRREEAKKAGDSVASHAIKILMNSFYGVLGASGCRFARPQLAGAVTSFGREILMWTQRTIEGYGYTVLYGDTDSLFVLSDAQDAKQARAMGPEIAQRLNADVGRYIAERWRVESKLELEFEKLYRRLLLQSQRARERGARKRYAGLIDDEADGSMEFVGLEVVRRDWTELAKEVQRQLYERLFRDQPVEAYLHDVVMRVRAGERNADVIYRKALRKALDEYTATTPPHVAAARKMSGKPGRVIRYVMTAGGPEPADELQHPIDHEHYVQKQIRPVAEPVLAVLDLDFDRVIGDDAQLTLW